MNEKALNKIIGQISTVLFCMLFMVNTASGIAGGRLETKSRSTAEIAERFVTKGSKASAKASAEETKAATASAYSKKQSHLAKAKKHHLKAISLYQKALKLLPNLSEARTNLGYALLKTGNYSDAISALDAALILDNNNEKALSYKAQAQIGLQQNGS